MCYNYIVGKIDKKVIVENIKKYYIYGFSISEVAKKVEMSPSGVKYILKRDSVTIRLRSDAVRLKHNTRLKSYSSFISKKIPKNLQNLYLISLALYWGEGSKTGNTIAITNSDPDIILIFLKFLRKICKVDEKRIHILIHYHSDQNENKLVSYWSSITKVSKSNFYKSTIHTKNKKQSTKRLKFGTISLRYSDSLLFKEILARIDELKKIG